MGAQKKLSFEFLNLLKKMIQQKSVTPQACDCFSILENELKPLGYLCWIESGLNEHTQQTTYNFFARKDAKIKDHDHFHLCFVGHVDVVPAGSGWTLDPFDLTEKEGKLYGRGIADMKGAIVAWVDVLKEYKNLPENISLSLLLTSDEEGPGTYGLKWFLPKLKEKHNDFSLFLIGEPVGFSQESTVGQTLFVGRRGSMTFQLQIKGQQGHLACPEVSVNPAELVCNWVLDMNQEIDRLNKDQSSVILGENPENDSFNHQKFKKFPKEVQQEIDLFNNHQDSVLGQQNSHDSTVRHKKFDDRDFTEKNFHKNQNTDCQEKDFSICSHQHKTAPTIFRISSIVSDFVAENVTPGFCTVSFGIRYNVHHSKEKICQIVEKLCEKHFSLKGARYDLITHYNGDGYYTNPSQPLVQEILSLLQKSLQKEVYLKNNEGTTDGRFVTLYYPDVPIVELGAPSDTIHQIDEHMTIEDLILLRELYKKILDHFLQKKTQG